VRFVENNSCHSPEMARFRKSIVCTGEYFFSNKFTYDSTALYSSSFPVIRGIKSIRACFASSAVKFVSMTAGRSFTAEGPNPSAANDVVVVGK
jgi:hypothetical protein